jgi:hypothetical protein
MGAVWGELCSSRGLLAFASIPCGGDRLGGKAGGPLTAFDAEGKDILLSPPPDLNRFISLSSSLRSSSQGDPARAPYRDIMCL